MLQLLASEIVTVYIPLHKLVAAPVVLINGFAPGPKIE